MTEADFVTDNPYLAGRVKRYATWPVIHQQSTGEHSWAIACIYEQIFGRPTADVEYYIRHHDTAEVAVGDPPFPVKSKSTALKAEYDRLELIALKNMNITLPELTQEESARIKVCDLIEMTLFGLTELQMGNRLAVPIIRRTSAAALTLSESRLSGDEHRSVVMFLEREQVRHDTITLKAQDA